jgi:transcriptional regulator with XRE-family HTH domain
LERVPVVAFPPKRDSAPLGSRFQESGKRFRLERGLSQRDLSSRGISYAYISRIESGARTPSVKALRRIAGKLGVTVEHLETGEPTPVERGVADAGLEFASLTAKELRAIEAEAGRGAREGAQRAAEEVVEERREAEVARLRKRLDELAG